MKALTLFLISLFIIWYVYPVSAQTWTLDSCLSYAESHNKTLITEAQTPKAATQEKKYVKSQLLPQIEIRSEIDHYWKIPVQVFPGELVGQPAGTYVPLRLGTPWTGNYGLEASLNLIDVQRWKQIKLAALQEKAASLEYSALKKQLLKNVRMAFYNLQLIQENNAIAIAEYQNYQEIHQLIAQKFDQGLIDKIALNQSKSLLYDREDYLTRSVVSLKSAFIDLKFWMGFPLNDSLRISPASDHLHIEFSSFNESLLPDYRARRLDIDLAKQNWEVSRAAWSPNLSLTSTYQRAAYGEKLDFIRDAKWYDIGFAGIRLSFPLFALNKTVYGPAKQKVMWKKAQLEFERYLNEQERNFIQETILLKGALQAIKQQTDQLVLVKENEQLAVKKIEKGIIDMIQLKEVQEDLYRSQQKLNDKKLDFFKHQVELIYLQGDQQY